MGFKTYREVRLEHLLRKFTALDDGDEPYWYDRRDLIVAALDELGLRDAAPQTSVRTTEETSVLTQSAVAARDLEWVKAIHDACSNVSPSDPQGKPIDPADIKRCVDAHVRLRLQFLAV